MDPNTPLPLGKLPIELLEALLLRTPIQDPRVLFGPGIGMDCAVIDHGGPNLLVMKSDPITFATDEIGWYAVQVNANDIATTGAAPRWLLATLLLPEGKTTPALVERIGQQLIGACTEIGVTLVGGHTEITHSLDRPILIGTMLGEVARDKLVTPRGAQPGDRVLLTKGIPIEATAILAREFPERLRGSLTAEEVAQAAVFLKSPGISVLRDAQIALGAGRVTAMHDPTEGGLASALWELAEASQNTLRIEPAAIPLPPLAARICRAVGVDPMAAIASGALLLTVDADDSARIRQALAGGGILCAEIGLVEAGPVQVWQTDGSALPRPTRDEIARLFEEHA
jgi:hydrogenase expression/formation protein HypE